jgi:hypothetical protein
MNLPKINIPNIPIPTISGGATYCCDHNSGVCTRSLTGLCQNMKKEITGFNSYELNYDKLKCPSTKPAPVYDKQSKSIINKEYCEPLSKDSDKAVRFVGDMMTGGGFMDSIAKAATKAIDKASKAADDATVGADVPGAGPGAVVPGAGANVPGAGAGNVPGPGPGPGDGAGAGTVPGPGDGAGAGPVPDAAGGDKKGKLDMAAAMSMFKRDPKAQMATTILKILWDLIRFIVVIVVTIPIAGVFILIYVVFYSIYGILFYNGLKAENVAKIFKEMLIFIDKKDPDPVEKEEKPTFFGKIMLKVHEFQNFLFNNFYTINYLIAFVAFIIIFYYMIKNARLKMALIYFDASLILISLSYLYYIIRKQAKESDQVKKDYDEPTNNFYLITYGIYPILSVSSILYVLYSGYQIAMKNPAIKAETEKLRNNIKKFSQ